MPRYSIAFWSKSSQLMHKIVEMDTKEAALRVFFQNFVDGEYSKDEEGYAYFREDFDDSDSPSGNVIEI